MKSTRQALGASLAVLRVVTGMKVMSLSLVRSLALSHAFELVAGSNFDVTLRIMVFQCIDVLEISDLVSIMPSSLKNVFLLRTLSLGKM